MPHFILVIWVEALNEIVTSIFSEEGPNEVLKFFDSLQPLLMENLFSEVFSVIGGFFHSLGGHAKYPEKCCWTYSSKQVVVARFEHKYARGPPKV